MPGRNYTPEQTETPNVEPNGPPEGNPSSPTFNLPPRGLDAVAPAAFSAPTHGESRLGADSELLKKAAAGDGGAFHALMDRHMDRLFRLAVSLVGNAADAEDLLQETFAGAYRGLDRFEGRASVGTWLTRILVMQIARFRRDRRRKPLSLFGASSEADLDVPAIGAPSGASGVDARIDLQAALLQLSAAHREVLVLREFEQMSYEEIADVLGVPQGTVESRLHRARAELREKLSAYLP